MLFPLICVLLVLIVLGIISLPLLFGASIPSSRGQYDRAVYRDQLREVERDVARGVLSPVEADAARLEIQRRLLAVDVAPDFAAGTESLATQGPNAGNFAARGPARSPRMAATAALFVLLGAGGLYWHLGTPTLPDVPYAGRVAIQAEGTPPRAEAAAAPHNEMKEAAIRLEQRLSADPSNAGGWVLYARTESMLGDWQKAADAYRRAIDLGQRGGDVMAGYGEMLVMAADGIVSPAARDAFVTALGADAANGVARYYLALADGQAGDGRKAIDAWLELAAGLPEDSPMRMEIGRRIQEAAKTVGIAAPPLPKGLVAEAPPSGPTPEQMAAAAEMPPEQRARMIAGMIEKLADKLKAEPNDLEGWLRLGRAYAVQGDSVKAVDAYDHAAALKPGDPAIKLQTVAAMLSGMKPADTPPPRAVAMLGEVAAVAPDAPEVLWYLGVVAVRDGRMADAREKWTRLLSSLPPGGEDDKLVRAALGELREK